MATGDKTAAEVADAGTGSTLPVVDEAVKPYKIHVSFALLACHQGRVVVMQIMSSSGSLSGK